MMINNIFSTAEKILGRMDNGKSGYLALCQKTESGDIELLQMSRLGTIEHKEDPDFGTKSKKYRHYAEKKCIAIFETPGAITSGKSTFAIKGAIKVNDSLILGYSGMTQDQDEALVIATIRSLKHDLKENNVFGGDGPLLKLSDFREVSDNPMLSDENITKLIRGY